MKRLDPSGDLVLFYSFLLKNNWLYLMLVQLTSCTNREAIFNSVKFSVTSEQT